MPILSTNLSDFIVFTLISIETNYNLLYYTRVYCKVLYKWCNPTFIKRYINKFILILILIPISSLEEKVN